MLNNSSVAARLEPNGTKPGRAQARLLSGGELQGGRRLGCEEALLRGGLLLELDALLSNPVSGDFDGPLPGDAPQCNLPLMLSSGKRGAYWTPAQALAVDQHIRPRRNRGNFQHPAG